MGTEIAVGGNPMDAFMGKLAEDLRDNIAKHLPEEAVSTMIRQVIHKEFFAKRKVRRGNGYDAKEVEIASEFEELVIAAARPIIEAAAATVVAQQSDVIHKTVREVVEAGAVGVVAQALGKVISGAFAATDMMLQQKMIDMLRQANVPNASMIYPR